MDTSGPAVLIWTCPRCGYRLRVTGPLDSSFELFLARADVHLGEGVLCEASRRREGANPSLR